MNQKQTKRKVHGRLRIKTYSGFPKMVMGTFLFIREDFSRSLKAYN